MRLAAGLCPDLLGELYSAPPDSLAAIKEFLLLRGLLLRGGRGRGKEGEGEGRRLAPLHNSYRSATANAYVLKLAIYI